MKHFLTACLTAFLVQSSFGQAVDSRVFNGTVSMGDQAPVYATNILNNGTFYVTNGFLTFPQDVYGTFETLNFTNRGLMNTTVGFRFDHTPSGNGKTTRANNFVNANSVNTNKIFGQFLVEVHATNVINSGIIEAGAEGKVVVSGGNLDLSRGTLRVNGFDTNIFFFNSNPVGIFDTYWGTWTNSFFSLSAISNVVGEVSAFSPTTNLAGGIYQQSSTNLSFISPTVFVYTNATAPSNIYQTIVFINNTNPAVSIDVRFQGFRPIVQWSNLVANPTGVGSTTNLLYLTDSFAGNNNLGVSQHSRSIYTPIGTSPTYAPLNYSFSRAVPTFLTISNFIFVTNGYSSLPTNNSSFSTAGFVTRFDGDSTAYGAEFLPISFQPSHLTQGASITNQTGRIEIRGDQVTLNKTRIDGLNYMLLKSTNHFAGSSNAFITVPYNDITLATTNGMLMVSNLVSAYIPRFVGEVHLWSGRWTNIDANDITNHYHVLMVDSHLDPKFPTKVNTLDIRSTNVFLSDVLNIQSNLMVNAERVTLTTNVIAGVGGELNIESPFISLADSFPSLLWFTNYGRVTSVNDTFFGVPQRLQTFVNRGSIDNEGNTIYASIFENSGTIRSRSGAFYLHGTVSALTNGVITTENGDILIQSTNLLFSGHTLTAARSISFEVSGQLSDFTVPNIWECHDGFNLVSRPSSGDLFRTTVTNIALDNAEVVNTWAALDRGPAPDSFTNSTTIGRLVLDGGTDSQFTFNGASASNALYIDYLELKNNATNIGALSVNPNIKIYVAASSPLSPEKLNLFYPNVVWASGYKGLNSSTLVTLRNGQTILVNSSLPGSTTIDSDGDGVPNSIDPFPLDGLQVEGATNANLQTVSISWYADSASWQYVIEYSTDLVHWSTLTTVTSGPVAGQQMTYQDSLSSGVHRFYRVSTLSH